MLKKKETIFKLFLYINLSIKGEYVESEYNYLEALKMETKISYLLNLGVLYHR